MTTKSRYESDMLSDNLAAHYCALQQWTPEIDGNYGDLVVPNGNTETPFHRWFHIKEAFSAKLVKRVLDDLGMVKLPDMRMLDPFAGGATTLLSALQLCQEGYAGAMTAYGIECNPFLRFVGETKVQALRFAPRFREFAARVVDLAKDGVVYAGKRPLLSTFHNGQYFSADTLDQLVRLRSATMLAEGTPLEQDLARLCLAATIEPASALRRDGRALRYVPDKTRADVLVEFGKRSTMVAEDIEGCQAVNTAGQVYLGDGRRPETVLPPGAKFDLILFSPPYPNNIDYTEVYKLEAWLLGFIDSTESFRRQRLLTLRSHPSVRFPDSYGASMNGYAEQFSSLLQPLLDEVPRDGDRAWRRRLIIGYFDDMFETLRNHRSLLKDKGRLVFVVGNSLHGSGERRFLIATDLILAKLSQIAGYEVERFVAARMLRRKALDLPLLRESIVFLKKSEDSD